MKYVWLRIEKESSDSKAKLRAKRVHTMVLKSQLAQGSMTEFIRDMNTLKFLSYLFPLILCKLYSSQHPQCRKGQGIFVEDKHIVFKLHNAIENVLSDRKAKKKKAKRRTKSTQSKFEKHSEIMSTVEAADLMKLSKLQLIKKLKAAGIVCTGSKDEMIIKLLTTKIKRTKLERKQQSFYAIKSKKDYLSMDQCNIIVINYFIKPFSKKVDKLLKNNRNRAYESVIVVILQYMENVLPCFDLYSDTYSNDIKKKGSVLKRCKYSNEQCLYGSSKGFAPFSGIHRFSVRIKKLRNARNRNGAKEKDEIGLISDCAFFDRDNENDIALWNVDCDSYSISLSDSYGTHKIQSGACNQDKIVVFTNESEPIKPKDIITMHIDMDEGKLFFEKNSKRYCETFDIIKDNVYYPAICATAKGNEYEVVFY